MKKFRMSPPRVRREVGGPEWYTNCDYNGVTGTLHGSSTNERGLDDVFNVAWIDGHILLEDFCMGLVESTTSNRTRVLFRDCQIGPLEPASQKSMHVRSA
ncbi:hypothetical protein VNO77_03952 [Canavalia gladiata]|uniref:Uncharacterized protein n=1 Tax=Canavalia gladiata TaxID=3824 RepID=A0AAN9R8L6_CANGL